METNKNPQISNDIQYYPNDFNFTNRKYTFFWQSNSDPYNENQIKTWNLFDQNNQINLNSNYEKFCKDSTNYCYPLLYPLSNYKINFKKMHQIHQIDTFRIRPIKIENFNKNSSSEPDYEDEFLFFWKTNDDPFNFNEKPKWAPYDEEDQYILKQTYLKYLSDKVLNIVELKKPADHFICFSNMLQINKNDPSKQRPVQRCHPNLVTNIVRKNRFYSTDKNSKINPEFIEQLKLGEYNFKNFFQTINQEKEKKINTIYFKVFHEFPCKLEIEEQLCFFNDGASIETSLDEIKFILIQEISNLSKHDSNVSKKYSLLKYTKKIKEITDSKSFFKQMVYLYTMEGFLYKKMNNFLRNSDKTAYDIIKYYYTCLLASFQYFSQTTNMNKDNDLIVYRASQCSENEFIEYKTKDNSNIFRIFKEFLSTSSDPEVPQVFFNKNNPEIKEFFWEIKIPKEIIKYESNNFADISNHSQFIFEKEILIRSGAIIHINQILPYTEKIGNTTIEFKNKFKKVCTLKTFSLASFFKLISIDPSVHHMQLLWNGLGKNKKNMIYLNEALQTNSIKSLNLDGNNLGEDDRNILYLKEALEKLYLIEELILSNNNLGKNEKNMFYLKEGLVKYSSIKFLDLSCNKFEGNEKNMLYLKEALENNNSIINLLLQKNYLGKNEKNMLYLKLALINSSSIEYLNLGSNNLGENDKNMLYLGEFLIKNKSIKKLVFSNNSLGINEVNIKFLRNILVNNNSIKDLNLGSNNLGKNENNLLYLKEALIDNNSIDILLLHNNNLGINDKNMYYLKEALFINKSITKLDLHYNLLGRNEKNIFYLKEALLINKSITKLDLKFNNLRRNKKIYQYLKEALNKNKSILKLGIYENNFDESEKKFLDEFEKIDHENCFYEYNFLK